MVLEEVVFKYYKPRNVNSGRRLTDIFLRIEESYFGRWNPETITKAHKLDMPGEFSGWGLFGEEPEMPNHLCEPFLPKKERMAYKADLIDILRDLEAIRDDFAAENRVQRLIEALLLTVQFLKIYIAYKN